MSPKGGGKRENKEEDESEKGRERSSPIHHHSFFFLSFMIKIPSSDARACGRRISMILGNQKVKISKRKGGGCLSQKEGENRASQSDSPRSPFHHIPRRNPSQSCQIHATLPFLAPSSLGKATWGPPRGSKTRFSADFFFFHIFVFCFSCRLTFTSTLLLFHSCFITAQDIAR